VKKRLNWSVIFLTNPDNVPEARTPEMLFVMEFRYMRMRIDIMRPWIGVDQVVPDHRIGNYSGRRPELVVKALVIRDHLAARR